MSVLFVLKDFLKTPGGVLFVFYKYIYLAVVFCQLPGVSSADTAVFYLAELRPS